MGTRLFLVRHGHTLWNHELRYQGHTDIELSAEGIAQAQALRDRLSRESFAVIYSSDLSRAYETARIINEAHRLEIQIRTDLKEINFGVWEGLTYHDLMEKFPDEVSVWQKTPHLLKIDKGESFSDLRDRALGAVKEIISLHREGDVLIVAHGGTIAALLCGILDEPLEKMWAYKQKNAAVNIIRFGDERAVLEVLNDTAHLPE
ncbi:MAG: alpha-ribazole phosphatase [Clostridia bacterium]|jgi:alpha-ribazole phosphatase|nr:alpha-ribazole phosphatase [Clostridia bacterium]